MTNGRRLCFCGRSHFYLHIVLVLIVAGRCAHYTAAETECYSRTWDQLNAHVGVACNTILLHNSKAFLHAGLHDCESSGAWSTFSDTCAYLRAPAGRSTIVVARESESAAPVSVAVRGEYANTFVCPPQPQGMTSSIFEVRGDGAHLTLENLTFQNCIVDGSYPADEAVVKASGDGATITLRSTIFRNHGSLGIQRGNSGGGQWLGLHGVAVKLYDAVTATIEDSTFSKNLSPTCGGAIYVGANATAHIFRSFFYENGAGHIEEDLLPNVGQLAQAPAGIGGGGICVDGGSLIAVNSNFTNNIAAGSDSFNAALIGNGGALALFRKATCQLRNCVFAGNSAKAIGGAIYAASGVSLLLDGCNTTVTETGAMNVDEIGVGIAASEPFDMACNPGQYHAKSTSRAIVGAFSGCPHVCPAGTYSQGGIEANTSDCSGFCSAGYFCLAGSWTNKQHACPAGKWSSTIGAKAAAACQKCPKGKFSDKMGASSEAFCKKCPAGWYGNVTGATSSKLGCVPCPAGTWLGDDGSMTAATSADSCEKCGRGRYGNGLVGQNTSLSCNACPGGKFSLLPAGQLAEHIACSSCEAGKYSNQGEAQTNSNVCKACAAGRYSDQGQAQTHAGVCKACSAGRYSDQGEGQTQASVCKACAEGKYSDQGEAQIDSNVCKACDNGRYSDQGEAQTTSSVCKACPEGRFGKVGDSHASLESACGQCQKSGTYAVISENAMSIACEPCPAGVFGVQDVSYSSPACGGLCARGYYCSAGSLQIDDKTAGLPCPAGKYQPLMGKSDVNDCKLCQVYGGSNTKSFRFEDIVTTRSKAPPFGKVLGAHEEIQCSCRPGFYQRIDTTKMNESRNDLQLKEMTMGTQLWEGCDKCGTGQQCDWAGLVETLVPAQRGYWTQAHEPNRFLPCINSNACLGGTFGSKIRKGSYVKYDLVLSNMSLSDCDGQRGYSGNLCANCLPGFALSRYGQKCEKCIEDPGLQTLALIGVMALSVFTIWYLQNSNRRGREDDKGKPSTVTIRILIDHSQTLLLVGGLANHGPEVFREITTTTATVSEAGVVASVNGLIDCTLGLNFLQRTYIMATLPAIICLISGAAYFLVKHFILDGLCTPRKFQGKHPEIEIVQKLKNSRRSSSSCMKREACTRKSLDHTTKGMVRVCVVSLFLIHPSVMDQLFASLQWYPEQINGRFMLVSAMEVEWGSSTHLPVMVVTLAGIFLYGILVPLAGVYMISRHMAELDGFAVSINSTKGESSLDSPESKMVESKIKATTDQKSLEVAAKRDWINKSIGFLTKGYSVRYSWWAMGPVLLRKMLIMCIGRLGAVSSVDSESGQMRAFVQSFIALLVMIFAYHLQISLEPFEESMHSPPNQPVPKYHNVCEQLSLATIVMTLLFSLLFSEVDVQVATGDAKWKPAYTFTLLLGALNALTLLYLCVVILIEIRYESMLKISRPSLLSYKSEAKLLDSAIVKCMPSFSCCSGSSWAKRLFPALRGLEWVSSPQYKREKFQDPIHAMPERGVAVALVDDKSSGKVESPSRSVRSTQNSGLKVLEMVGL